MTFCQRTGETGRAIGAALEEVAMKTRGGSRKSKTRSTKSGAVATSQPPAPKFIDVADINEVLTDARERPPINAVGILLVNTGGAMEAAPTFYWFESISDLIDFVFWVLPRMEDDDEETKNRDDVMIARNELIKVVQEAPNLAKAYERIEGVVDESGAWVRAEWIGTFDDLCVDESETAIDVRTNYWEINGDDGGEDGSKRIPASKRTDFAATLWELVN
jgi:hypothetical protein